MSLTPDEQQLAQDVLVSMQRLLERGGFLTRLELGAPESPKHPACGCALGADLWMRVRFLPEAPEALREGKAPLMRNLIAFYMAVYRVSDAFVAGIITGFDAEEADDSFGETESMPSYERGAAVGLFLQDWVTRVKGWG